MRLCACSHARYIRGGERTTPWSQLSPLLMWVLGTEHRLSGCPGSLLNHHTRPWLTLLVHGSASPLISELICHIIGCLSHACHIKPESVERWLGEHVQSSWSEIEIGPVKDDCGIPILSAELWGSLVALSSDPLL